MGVDPAELSHCPAAAVRDTAYRDNIHTSVHTVSCNNTVNTHNIKTGLILTLHLFQHKYLKVLTGIGYFYFSVPQPSLCS